MQIHNTGSQFEKAADPPKKELKAEGPVPFFANWSGGCSWNQIIIMHGADKYDIKKYNV